MENIKNATYEELLEIKDIGGVLAENIVSYFNNVENLLRIEEFKSLGINTEFIGKDIETNSNFENKKFVITGSFDNLSRDEIKEIIETSGGYASESVSKKTDVVIVGDNPGSKFEKAKELGIEIWDKVKLEEIIRNVN